MQLTHDTQNGIAILALAGRLDTRGAPELESRGRAIFRDGARQLLVDMANVDYISSAGLRVLLVLAKEAAACGGRLSLCCLTPAVNEVMTNSGFDTIIPLAADRQSALNTLQNPTV